jgi:hypothetical protein
MGATEKVAFMQVLRVLESLEQAIDVIQLSMAAGKYSDEVKKQLGDAHDTLKDLKLSIKTMK